MRILRVAHRMYPPKVGGLSYHAHQLSADQARDGHQVTVLTSLEGAYPRHEFRDGYEIFRDEALAWPLDNPINPNLLARLLQRSDGEYDVLHAHSHLMFTTNASALKRKLSRKPLVITNHGFRVRRGPLLNLFQDAYLATLGRWTLQTADWVISFTKRERDLTVTAGASPERAVVIPNGVNTKLFRPMAREPIPKSVLWTGRYVQEKGLPYLLKAAELVLRDVPEAKFILVGYGEQLPLLERFSEQLGLQSRVTFMAPKPQEEIVAILNQCTLFALPSLSEGFPNTVLEAMSCRKPVLVTSGIGLEEIVGDAGLYARAGDPRSIADRIISILKNERLAEDLGSRGRTRVRAMYDWEKTVKVTTRLFERAIKF